MSEKLTACSIGHTKDVDNETGVSAPSQGFRSNNDPESRLAEYGNAVAPLSVVYPQQRNIGRNDPIAMLARGIGSRDNQRKIGRANKEAQKGKSKKGNSLEGDVKWVSTCLLCPRMSANDLASSLWSGKPLQTASPIGRRLCNKAKPP